jgi:16S rRNA (cytidine1402-2'-O)-methyltransferase
MPGTLFVVATPIGNLEDISARALRVLGEVGLIAAEDTRRTRHLLSRYGITTPTTSFHQHNEGAKAAALVDRLKAGESVALVTDAGTPTLSDPGAHLVATALENGLRVEPIPGPSAALAALSVCGFPTGTFTFLGFPPTRSKARSNWFQELKAAARPVVFFEAPHRIRSTLEELQQTVGDIRVAVGRELTKAHEELVVGPISSVLRRLVREQGEFTVVANIGEMTEHELIKGPDADESALEIARQFGDMTDNEVLSRREAISLLARRHGLPPREVYSIVERFKK